MSADELATYQFQLEQVEEVLKADPNNTELLKLKGSLVELIQLVHGTTNPVSSSSSTSNHKVASSTNANSNNVGGGKEGLELIPTTATNSTIHWSKGQKVMAKYGHDGLFYEAVIDSINGDRYKVTFTGYGNSEHVRISDVRPVPPAPSIPSTASISSSGSNNNKTTGSISLTSTQEAANKKRMTESVFGPPPSLDRKKAKSSASNASHSGQTALKTNKKKEEKEEVVKQKAWLAFSAKGGSKKAAPVVRKSMFSTPDDPLAKVGIIGKPSAQTLTQFKDRTKHIFDV